MKCPVTLWPSGKMVEINSKKSLFSELKAAGVAIKSTCGGVASCALCTVVVKSGSENMNEMTFEEKQLLGNVFHITNERLSCQTFVHGPVTIDISAHDQSVNIPALKTKRRTPQEVEEIESRPKEVKPPKPGGFKRPKKFNFDEDED